MQIQGLLVKASDCLSAAPKYFFHKDKVVLEASDCPSGAPTHFFIISQYLQKHQILPICSPQTIHTVLGKSYMCYRDVKNSFCNTMNIHCASLCIQGNIKRRGKKKKKVHAPLNLPQTHAHKCTCILKQINISCKYYKDLLLNFN